MEDDKDIVARLLAVPAVAFEHAGQIGIEDPALAHEAAARIKSDAATIAALREALERIAAYDDDHGNEYLAKFTSYAGFDEPSAVKAARQALRSEA